MDSLRSKYRAHYQELEVRVGTNSAVLYQSFVAKSLQQDEHKDDGLDAFRGAVNAIVISLAIWAAIGVAIFALL